LGHQISMSFNLNLTYYLTTISIFNMENPCYIEHIINMIKQDPWLFVPIEFFESQLFDDMVKFISRDEY
jgi:hypothetical protein